MEETFARMLELLTSIAPEIERIARQAVKLEVVSSVAVLLFASSAWGVLTVLVKKFVDHCDVDDYREREDRNLVLVIFSIFSFLMAFLVLNGIFYYVIPRIFNPDWYVIENARTLILGK